MIKKGKILLVLAAAAAGLLCGCDQLESIEVGALFGMEKESETELKEGQRKAEIVVTSIVGNELTYYEVETEAETEVGTEGSMSSMNSMSSDEETGEKTQGSMSSMNSMSSDEENAEKSMGSMNSEESGESAEMSSVGNMNSSGRPDMSQMSGSGRPDMSQMFGRDGEMPDMSEMFGRDGEMPDMSQRGSGEMPDMSQMSSGEMPDMSQMFGGDGEMPDMSQMRGGRAKAVETVTVYLPVGTIVHTDKNDIATFSILEAGDELTVLFETNANGNEVITEIWMEGSSTK